MLLKDFTREIRRNKGRFLSIFFIVLLGSAFFSGIRSSGGDMKYSADVYYDDTDMMDIRVLSTLGLTDDDHPTQILADFLTAIEHTGKKLDQMKLAYVGDGRNNVANALMIGAAKVGMDYAVATPESLNPSEKLVSECRVWAAENGSEIIITADPYEAVKGADIIYTDIWCSMGEEDKMAERISLLKPYQVTMDLLKSTGCNTIFEHCLPSFHDLNTTTAKMVKEKFGLDEMEVTDEVFRSPASVVFDEAENRMHTIKAVMVATLSDKL